jgi:hypothetical protein
VNALDYISSFARGAPMFAAQRLMVILALAGTVHSAAADEATDAVQVLSKLWTGRDFGGSATQFVGDSTSFRMRVVTRNSDGTVSVATSEAPFGFLDENLDATPSAAWAPHCFPQRQCIFVQCLQKRECISIVLVTSDTVFHDPRFESRGSLKRSEQEGAVKPTDADTVKRALRTLIRVNAVPPFDPLAPR